MRKFALILALIMPTAFAVIYQHTNADGNLSFSDKPQPGSTITNLPKSDSFSTTKLPVEKQSQQHPVKTKASQRQTYTVFKFQHLQNRQTFQNQRQIPIMIALKPALQEGDIIEIWVDGKVYASSSTTKFVLENLDRGTHSIQARLVNADGQQLTSTPIVTIYIKYHSILLPAQSVQPINRPVQPILQPIQPVK